MLKVDNSGAYYLATNNVKNLNNYTKHVNIKYHFIKKKVKHVGFLVWSDQIHDILSRPGLSQPGSASGPAEAAESLIQLPV